ncbi:hypothetical protein JHK86_043764 [Glycine max]|nr:hypothetical protein JHK86_043764 [Glycine max]
MGTRSKRVDFIGQISSPPSPLSSLSPLSSSSLTPSLVESIITPISDHGDEYLMRFSLGIPGVERLAIFYIGE